MNIRDFCNELKERAHELEQMIQFRKKRCMISCNGYLLARNDRGVDRYYEVINSSGARIYLGNNQKDKIKALEEQFYYKKLCETAERELKQIEKALNDFSKLTDPEEVFVNLLKNRTNLIKPFEPSYSEIPKVYNEQTCHKTIASSFFS